LPEDCLTALNAIPQAGAYYFWTGNGKPKTRVGNFQAMLKEVYNVAKVQGGHAHRFRHTLAVELLLAGVPLERVAAILGNTAKIVEKHYAPWVQARQTQLEDDIRRTWEQVAV
jgi:integrase